MFRFLFVFICIVGVTGMIYYWVYKFLIDDRDIGVVDYEDIDESDMDLPVVSICIDHPFLEKNIEMRDSELNGSTYLKHLKGDIYEERFENFDYENLTLNLNDYLNKIKIDFRNGSAIYVYDLMAGHDITFNGFYYEWFLKCFGYPMDKKKYGKIKRVSYIYNGEDLVQDLPRLGQKIEFRSAFGYIIRDNFCCDRTMHFWACKLVKRGFTLTKLSSFKAEENGVVNVRPIGNRMMAWFWKSTLRYKDVWHRTTDHSSLDISARIRHKFKTTITTFKASEKDTKKRHALAFQNLVCRAEIRM